MLCKLEVPRGNGEDAVTKDEEVEGEKEGKEKEEKEEKKRKNGESVPEPPYSVADKPEAGLECFYPGCRFKCYRWGSVMDHLRNKHRRKMAEFNGTYLHTMALQE